MNLDSACLKLKDLEAFAFGNTPALDGARIQRHLDQCPSCRNAFQAVAVPTTAMNANLPPFVPNMTLPEDDSAAQSEKYSFLSHALLPDEIGRLGNYRVLGLLGQGGMGLVFLAEDVQLARKVALKVMKPEMSNDPDGGARFLRESRAMAAIKHDHLVTIYQAGKERDVVYFAMELLEGETLESWIRREPLPSAAEIVRLARQIASGLAFLHQKNLVHRDIKPANIWLEAPHRHVKILDLGLVRGLTDEASLTKSGTIVGTPEFMSPEQARDMPVDTRTDLFSLGGVLYYLCTKRKPFQGANSVAVLMALASETPTAVRELNPRVPAALSDLVTQLMARDPCKRPASTAEVLQRLEAMERDLTRTGAAKDQQGQAPDTQVILAPQDGQARSRKHAGMGVLLWLSVFAGVILLGVGGPILWTPRASLFPAKPAEQIVPANPPPEQVAFLSEIKETARENWPFKKGGPDPKEGKKKGPKDGKYKPLVPIDNDTSVRYQGKDIPRGIFMHPPTPPNQGEPCSLSYHLGKQYKTFQAEVSLRDGPQRSETPCTFWVFGDDKVLWKSDPVSTQQDAQKCVVSVKGVDELKISVICAGPPLGAHAIWIDPQLGK